MKYPMRSRYKHAKSQYRVRNWPEYAGGPPEAWRPDRLVFGGCAQCLASPCSAKTSSALRLLTF
jgi:hypothetical protein